MKLHTPIDSKEALTSSVVLGYTTEGLFLEFKESFSVPSEVDGKRRLAKEIALDIVQFVNAFGGFLLFGISEQPTTKLSMLKTAKEFCGVSDPEDLKKFLNHNVLPLISPSSSYFEFFPIQIQSKVVCSLSIPPAIDGPVSVSDLRNNAGFYCFPYRSDYGKCYYSWEEVMNKADWHRRRLIIVLMNLKNYWGEVELLSPVVKEQLESSSAWDLREYSTQLIQITENEVEFRTHGINYTVPFGLIREAWRTTRSSLAVVFHFTLKISSDRKRTEIIL